MKRNKILGAVLALALVTVSGASAYAAVPEIKAVPGAGLCEVKVFTLDEGMPLVFGETITLSPLEISEAELVNFKVLAEGEMPVISGGTITFDIVAMLGSVFQFL
ncbi:hypothetical protein SDC9_201386 [bioreactor metagenome]|uniref:Uncharacterized protein n=1 Tax=bioreactor metagenome TaxID=1076179 RepID=A0A645IS07_9ZZZZ